VFHSFLRCKFGKAAYGFNPILFSLVLAVAFRRRFPYRVGKRVKRSPI
jgi:hypothetical protein